jgi:hypothetical protein
MLYVDIPTAGDVAALASYKGALCVSIYLPTTPVTQNTKADRIALKNLTRQAAEKIRSNGGDGRSATLIAEQIYDLVDDYTFWRFQAHTLAIFATPQNVRTFRLPNAIKQALAVSDRFYVKPLLRSISFANAGYVLALAQRNVRLVEVSPDLPANMVEIEAMPEDAGRAVRGVGVIEDWPSGRIQNREGQKIILRQFARKVDHAMRPVLSGSDLPLILATTETLAAMYRSVNTYTGLADAMIEGSPENRTEAELADRARPILDAIYRDRIAAWRALFEVREGQGRATNDIAQAARAATFGAVDTILVDIDEVVSGRIDDRGSVSFAKPDEGGYDLVDEIVTRTLAAGGRAIGVRKADLPHEESLAAILRYPA